MQLTFNKKKKMSFLSRLFQGPTFSTEAELKALIKTEHLILDVRSEQEFAQSHIIGAVNIPVHQVSHYIHDIKEQKKKIILYCRSGARASTAKRLLERAGIETYNAGGISNLHRIVR